MGAIAQPLFRPTSNDLEVPMLIKNLKFKAAVAVLAGGLTLTGGLAGAGAVSGGDRSAPDTESELVDFPSSTDSTADAEAPAEDAPADDRDSADEGDDEAKQDKEAKEAKEAKDKADREANDKASDAAGHGAEVKAVAQNPTPDGYKNHGAAVCEVASRGKCMPEHDKSKAKAKAKDNAPSDPGAAEMKSFADQVERCDAKGDEKAVMFREDHKREQANLTHDKEAACEAKFEAKGDSGSDTGDEEAAAASARGGKGQAKH